MSIKALVASPNGVATVVASPQRCRKAAYEPPPASSAPLGAVKARGVRDVGKLTFVLYSVVLSTMDARVRRLQLPDYYDFACGTYCDPSS